MMKKIASSVGLVGLLGVLFSCHYGPVHTQTTTCPAGTTSGTAKSNTPFTLYWCAPASDNVTGANAYGLGAATIPVASLSVVGGPFGDGLVQLRGTIAGVPKGTYTMTLTDVNSAGESARSAPFDLSVVDPPAAPTKLRVQ